MTLGPDEKALIKNTAEGIAKGALAPIHDLIRDLAAPGAIELGDRLAMEVRFWKLKRAARLAERVREFLEPVGINRRPVPLKMLLPSIEQASLEEDDELQDRWAALLANAATHEPESTPPAFLETLRQLSPRQARFMDDLVDDALSASKLGKNPAELGTGEFIQKGSHDAKIWESHPTALLAVGMEHDLRNLYVKRLDLPPGPAGEYDVQWADMMNEKNIDYLVALQVLIRSGILTLVNEIYHFTRFGYAFVVACRPPSADMPRQPIRLRAR